jgi:16S rRNA (adenine1518-N6/adenine1519-N6)-dimethyltransferase
MVTPKKYLGQHFLEDETVVQRTAQACVGLASKQVIEVGPGEGVLTVELLKYYDDLMVIELDQESVQHLRKNEILPEKRIISDDFLKWTIPQGEWILAGNFPYNISSQIVFKMLESRDRFVGMVGMFQKEVAERIVSKPGSKVYGITSVLTQAFYDAEYLFTVEAEAFRPPPKVQSGVIRLKRRDIVGLGCDEEFFKRIVKQSFNQRRKMLRNTLKEYIDDGSAPEIESYLNQRPEQLHYNDFIKLAQLLKP